MIIYCDTLIITGIFFLIIGGFGTIGLKAPQLGYIGPPMGFILIIVGLLLQMIGFC